MIATVSLTEGTTYARAPWRFEAGTPNTGGIIGLGAAVSYVSAIGLDSIQEYEQLLMHYALAELANVPDLTSTACRPARGDRVQSRETSRL